MSNIEDIKKMLQLSGCELNLPISMAYLNELENRLNIILPNDFKLFYSTISNGKASPFNHGHFGLFTIEEMEKRLKEKTKFYKINIINKEFNFDKPWIWGDKDSYELHPTTDYGNLEIVDMGCGMSWNLIVKGNPYGTMWNFSEWGIQPCCPNKDNPNLNFLDWFEVWFKTKDNFFNE